METNEEALFHEMVADMGLASSSLFYLPGLTMDLFESGAGAVSCEQGTGRHSTRLLRENLWVRMVGRCLRREIEHGGSMK